MLLGAACVQRSCKNKYKEETQPQKFPRNIYAIIEVSVEVMSGLGSVLLLSCKLSVLSGVTSLQPYFALPECTDPFDVSQRMQAATGTDIHHAGQSHSVPAGWPSGSIDFEFRVLAMLHCNLR